MKIKKNFGFWRAFHDPKFIFVKKNIENMFICSRISFPILNKGHEPLKKTLA